MAPAMFHGWRIVTLAFLTNYISVGFVFYSYGVFFKALASEFSGSRLGVSVGLTCMSLMSALWLFGVRAEAERFSSATASSVTRGR